MLHTLSKFAALMLFTNPMGIQLSIEEDVGERFRPMLFLQNGAQLVPMYAGEAVDSEDQARKHVESVLVLVVNVGKGTNLQERTYIEDINGPKLDESHVQRIAWNRELLKEAV